MPAFRSIGDLAGAYQLNRQTSALKAEVQRRTTELGSGRVADIPATLRGDYRTLASIERALTLAASTRFAIVEARSFTEGVQTALRSVEAQSEAVSEALLQVNLAQDGPAVVRAGMSAMGAFEAAVGALNHRVAGRSLFAGAATDSPALASAETMMTAITAAAAGETTAAGVIAAVEAWFAPGGGFEASGYLGSDEALAPSRLDSGETAGSVPSAADPGLRAALTGMALGALLDRPVLSGALPERRSLAAAAAEIALNATGRVTDLRARVGGSEAAIAAAETRLSSEISALELARGDLIGSDPYEAATRLENTQTKLETLYALTARVSRLSLADFLR